LNLIAPIAEQCQHHLFHRDRPELEYAPIYRNYGYKTTVFSALAGGLLTGKYNDGIPEDSRFGKIGGFSRRAEELKTPSGQEKIEKVRKLTEFAKELGTTPTVLSLAWVAKLPNTGTVILGASSPQQVKENLATLDVLPKMTDDVMKKIDEIMGTKPEPEAEFRQKL